MDIENLSIDEALVSMLVEQDGVDATNAIHLLRAAQAKVIEYTGARTPEEVALHLSGTRSIDEVDSILILVSENGKIDLFRD
uniref:Helix-turn-helix DNA binding domain protein n=1 Tax=Micrococcus phage Olihed TaxID=3092209 RepID=A0AAU6R5W4_9CAUD